MPIILSTEEYNILYYTYYIHVYCNIRILLLMYFYTLNVKNTTDSNAYTLYIPYLSYKTKFIVASIVARQYT